jgi:MSHA biogenesis protein MshK
MSAMAESLRDPTQPLGYRAAASQPVRLNLNSILISEERKLAIINGQQLRENDTIPGSGGTVLRRIEAGSVVVQQGDKSWRLRLSDQSIRR